MDNPIIRFKGDDAPEFPEIGAYFTTTRLSDKWAKRYANGVFAPQVGAAAMVKTGAESETLATAKLVGFYCGPLRQIPGEFLDLDLAGARSTDELHINIAAIYEGEETDRGTLVTSLLFERTS